MAATEKCVICLGKAVSFGGHVHIGNQTIIAGFCKEHFNFKKKLGRDDCKGCYGEWTEEMGIDDLFCTVGSIDKDGFNTIID
jgi:hypothetical protein